MYCLSFDIEEFDLPRELGYDIEFGRQMEVSRQGAGAVLDILEKHGVKATFFVTVNFAEHAPEVLARIVSGGHELASHGMNHWHFEPEHVAQSKQRLHELSGVEVSGFRMARMAKVESGLFASAGYLYDSSLNPTFIPGRYNHLNKPRTPFMMPEGVLQIPTSVSPWIRFPMFWLAGHLLPPPVYRAMARRIHAHDGYFATYFHPWEFYDLHSLAPDIKIPLPIRHRSGEGMRQALDALIADAKKRGIEFGTYRELAQSYISK